jgi:ubiquinone/menaquinone biosynthesis C-methylase UbiE
MIYEIHGSTRSDMPLFCYADENDRRRWQNPEQILSAIGIRPGTVILDIGCGEGFFAIPAAKITGSSGKVIGIDNNGEAVSRMIERAEQEGLENIQGIIGMAEKTVACRGCADFIFFGIDLHDFDDPGKVLANARLMIKPKGILVDLDWRKESTPQGPPVSIRFDEEYAATLITKAGFRVTRRDLIEPWFYQLTAQLRI